jgi:hypothetical protein
MKFDCTHSGAGLGLHTEVQTEPVLLMVAVHKSTSTQHPKSSEITGERFSTTSAESRLSAPSRPDDQTHMNKAYDNGIRAAAHTTAL